MGLRVFLSYGHDEYAPTAHRIRTFLEEQGHEVWFDRDRLTPGRDWEAVIEQGLDWAAAGPGGRVVLVMTPHSVRRPDGFCLNEIARALERRLPIVPVMLVWVQPPLSISRIQWLDLTACVPLPEREAHFTKGLKALGDALETGLIDVEGGQAMLLGLLNPLSFDEEIGRHSTRFAGRQWALRTIENWLADPSPASRVFWIVGQPGIGKTALAVKIATTRPEVVAWHFCRAGHARKSDPVSCVTSLAYQLAAQIPDYLQRLLRVPINDLLERTSNARTLFDELIVQPLLKLPDPGRVMAVMIDALDEATKAGRNDIAFFIANDFERVPSWLRLIVTSRATPELDAAFFGRARFDLGAHPEEGRRDLGDFLRKEAPQLAEADGLDRIIAEADGNFLYAEAVRRELAEGQLALNQTIALPRGLVGIYADFFQRQFPDLADYKKRVRPFLEIVAAAQGELPLDAVAETLGWDQYERKETVEALGAIYPLDGGFIRPFHKSLTDWLTDDKVAGSYWVSTRMGHSRLADLDGALLGRGAKQSAPRAIDELITYRLPPAAPAHAGEDMAAYSEQNRLIHLIEARRFDDFRRELSRLTGDILIGDADERRRKRSSLQGTLERVARDWPADADIAPLADALVGFADAGGSVGHYGEKQYVIARALDATLAGMHVRSELAATVPKILDRRLLAFLQHPVAEIDMAAYSALDSAIRRARDEIGSDPAFSAWAADWDAYLN